MIKSAIQKLAEGKDLSENEAKQAMNCIMEGNATDAQIGSFITALRIKGETIEEITGCAKVLREKSKKILPDVKYCIDTCGTGGDGSNTFNISTAAAIVAAAGGTYVAKHGNRSVSSSSGSADVLEALGVKISLTEDAVKKSIEKVGIGFMFAPNFHKSMKYAAQPRKELGIRTIFNIIGPLTNPASAKGQVMGVFTPKLTEPIAQVLLNLGIEKAMVIHGMDGMDEITINGITKVSEVKEGKVLSYEISPEMFNLKSAKKEALKGNSPKESAEIIEAVFNGEKGPRRDVVVLNSAAALYVGKSADNIKEGVKIAEDIIDSGKALNKLRELKEFVFNLN